MTSYSPVFSSFSDFLLVFPVLKRPRHNSFPSHPPTPVVPPSSPAFPFIVSHPNCFPRLDLALGTNMNRGKVVQWNPTPRMSPFGFWIKFLPLFQFFSDGKWYRLYIRGLIFVFFLYSNLDLHARDLLLAPVTKSFGSARQRACFVRSTEVG